MDTSISGRLNTLSFGKITKQKWESTSVYIGLTNILLAPVKALAPLLGGWLATWAGYRGMFVVALLVSILGGALLALWVQEPRHIRQGRISTAA